MFLNLSNIIKYFFKVDSITPVLYFIANKLHGSYEFQFSSEKSNENHNRGLTVRQTATRWGHVPRRALC